VISLKSLPSGLDNANHWLNMVCLSLK
jgi:hypothetical protein